MSLLLRGIAVLVLVCVSPLASAGETDLIALMRQLESLERQAERSAALAAATPSQGRYHFDYIRLQEDMRRIHDGIHDFLTPVRAQPRVPVELYGDYRQEFTDQEVP